LISGDLTGDFQPHEAAHHSAARRHGDFNLQSDAIVAEDFRCADSCGTSVVGKRVAPLDAVGHIGGGFVFDLDEVESASRLCSRLRECDSSGGVHGGRGFHVVAHVVAVLGVRGVVEASVESPGSVRGRGASDAEQAAACDDYGFVWCSGCEALPNSLPNLAAQITCNRL
jgi:hypothetical protein